MVTCPSCRRGNLYLVDSEKFKGKNVSICDQCLDAFIGVASPSGEMVPVFNKYITNGFRHAMEETETPSEVFKRMVRTFPVYHGSAKKLN